MLNEIGSKYDGRYILSEDLLQNSEIVYSYGVGPNEPALPDIKLDRWLT